MGILNVTPDSFFDGGQYRKPEIILQRAEKMLQEGAAILDIGGLSTRPGSQAVSAEEEVGRVVPAIKLLKAKFPDVIVSIDTYRAPVARAAVDAGASIINDVSGGEMDQAMFQLVATLQTPYILMHMQGNPAEMQKNPQYENVTRDVLNSLVPRIGKLRSLGVKDIVVDPGFGFGKSLAHNFQLLNELHAFRILDLPILAGISRKSIICKSLGVTPADALNGTTALHMVALQQGAKILRVHDVKEAVETITLFQSLQQPGYQKL